MSHLDEMKTENLAVSLPPSNSGSTDFVKKLYQMLEEETYRHIVRWSPSGDSFMVLDTNEFTKDILPKHFKHSNFASFVRQLNKYDFHKVKLSTEERKHKSVESDNTWEFRHPDFREDDKQRLENIKRKGPTQKKSGPEMNADSIIRMERSIEALQYQNDLLQSELVSVKSKYNSLVEGFLLLQRDHSSLFQVIGQLTNAVALTGADVSNIELPTPSTGVQLSPAVNIPRATPVPEAHTRNVSTSQHFSPIPPQHQSPPPPPRVIQPQVQRPSGSQCHVLLVEDDAVCIQLCCKFLTKYGCTVEVVTDGLSAISVVESIKFDLVLMDIVMPNLDGATATSVIRSFDKQTPIIAMTGNIEDQDLVNYLNHGMSDILAKPFTKDDLYMMLEKHLINKKIIDPSSAVYASGHSNSSSINSMSGITGDGAGIIEGPSPKKPRI